MSRANGVVGNSAWRWSGHCVASLAQLTALCVLAIPPCIRASDQVPVKAAPTDDAIAAARQQLDVLKSDTASKPPGINPGSAPSINVPQLDPSAITGPTITLTPTTDKNAAKKKVSKNWLVDGVMKQERADRLDAQNPRRVDRAREKRDTLTDATENSEDSLDQSGTAADPESELKFPTRSNRRTDKDTPASSEPKEAPKDTFNPLAQYMASWLAPQDYRLLRHAADTPGRSSALPSDNVPSSLGLPTDASAGSTLPGDDLGGRAPSRSFAALPSPADNPFLQFLSPPESAPVNVTPPAPQMVTPPIPPPLPPPQSANPLPPASTLPDFVKPDTDDKYFKPLKRF